MTIKKAMRTYRLPNPTTTEDLECRWSKVLNFGDKILLAGYYYNGAGKPSYFGAVYEHLDDDLSCESIYTSPLNRNRVYEHLDDDLSCEGTIGLRAASGVDFDDDGHAIAWAMAH